MSQSIHLHALILALASSTDNFCIGLSLGIQQKRLSIPLNGIISLCNASGALLAGHGGSRLNNAIAPLLASAAFGFLGFKEWTSTSVSSAAPKDLSLSLAIPMTLNNLACGVAGGVAGIPPLMAGGYALAASFTSMWAGYRVGQKIGARLPLAPNEVAGGFFYLLSFLTLVDMFYGFWNE